MTSNSPPRHAPSSALLWCLVAAAVVIIVAAFFGFRWYSDWEQRRVAFEELLAKQRDVLESIEQVGGTVVVASETKAAVSNTSLFSEGDVLFEEGTVLLVDVAGIAEFGDAELERLCRWTKPERLNLRGTAVTDEGLKAIAKIEKLEYLNLRDTKITDAGIEYLAYHLEYVHLDLSGTDITDASIDAINGIYWMYSLWLDRTEITDHGVKSLQGASLISLADTHAGDSALEPRYIRVVNMHGLKITDAGLREGFETSRCRNVWWDLSDTLVTDDGIEHLKSATMLLKLTLDGTGVSESAIAELRKSLPQCAINGVPPQNDELSAHRAAGMKLADGAIANTLVGRPVTEVADLLQFALGGGEAIAEADGIYAFDFGTNEDEWPITLWVRTGEGYVLSVIFQESLTW